MENSRTPGAWRPNGLAGSGRVEAEGRKGLLPK